MMTGVSNPNPKAVWLAEIRRVAVAHRWPWAIAALGWLHLAFFLMCQSLVWFLPEPRPLWPFPVLWFVEVGAVVGTMCRICGRRWAGGSPIGLVVVRVWATYLILAFGLSTLNSFSGWEHSWYKPVWGTLGTFGFATMAWLFNPWFLVPAVQMYFTSLLMVRFPDLNFLIHGLSWWVALNGIGLILARRLARADEEPSPVLVVQVPVPATPPSRPVSVPLGPLAIALVPDRTHSQRVYETGLPREVGATGSALGTRV